MNDIVYTLSRREIDALRLLTTHRSRAIWIEHDHPLYPTGVVVELEDNSYVNIQVEGRTFAPKFECFRLSITRGPPSPTSRVGAAFDSVKQVSVLFRREYQQNLPAPSDLVGDNPVLQTTAHPSQPVETNLSVIVASGLYLEGAAMTKLAIIAHEFPLAVRIVQAQDNIGALLDNFSIVALDEISDAGTPLLKLH